MIDIKVNKGKTNLTLDGELKDITAEFFILTRSVYKGVKESGGEIRALFFKDMVLSHIATCFEEDNDARDRVRRLITGIEEIIKMFEKEEK